MQILFDNCRQEILKTDLNNIIQNLKFTDLKKNPDASWWRHYYNGQFWIDFFVDDMGNARIKFSNSWRWLANLDILWVSDEKRFEILQNLTK